MKKSFLIWIPATILAGIVAVGSGYNSNGVQNQTFVNRVTREEKNGSMISDNYLEFMNTNEIVIRNLSFNPPGYVVFREEVSGNPSGIIGVSKLIENEKEAFIFVTLSRDIKKDDVIYVNYYIDNGDRKFDSKLDSQKETLLGDNSYIKLIVFGGAYHNSQEL